ncbi:hypothetical protein HYDPIDRAFT_24260 [Hydnomerulius pinastri MD-312]|nr:hypothetical protein HYDPIDRAFT_24260 [Hydnomerulius pinastri MD-312]
MPAERRRAPPTISLLPRSSFESDRHRDVDALLKDLKACSRRLRVAMSSFTDELRVLERLYYKSKNQHRMALFFKRVPEIRRYGQRLVELDLPERVDLLRASFVGLNSTKDQKALRSTWNHVPESPYVSFMMERLTSCSTLVCKMRERLEEVYHHFALAMQSGAFIQLVILFAAISSRMSALLPELEEVLRLGTSICDRLLAILDPTHKTTTNAIDTVEQLSAGPEILRPPKVDLDMPLEDVGRSVSRQDPIDTSFAVAEDSTAESSILTMLEMRITPPLTRHEAPDVVERTIIPAIEKATVKATKSTTPLPEKPKLKKAKKKKRDEIDAIFAS